MAVYNHNRSLNGSAVHTPVKVLPIFDGMGSLSVNPRILELENKPKPVLAHDQGAGSACLNCTIEQCPTGLDLHFWRKICRTCKCRKEDHNVHDTEWDPGKIRIGKLFDRPPAPTPDASAYNVVLHSPPARPPERDRTPSDERAQGDSALVGARSSVRNLVSSFEEKRAEQETGSSTPSEPTESGLPKSAANGPQQQQRYEWIPPEADSLLVHKYMHSLPADVRPIAGTEGALKRRQALEYQFPLHDCDPNAMHRELTEEEAGAMDQYLDLCKTSAVGQGVVRLLSTIPEEEAEEEEKDLQPPPFPPPPPPLSSDSLSEVGVGSGGDSGAEASDARENGYSGTAASHGDGKPPIPKSCRNCGEEFKKDEPIVLGSHNPEDAWHPGCFVCCRCERLLVDMLYFYDEGSYYCGRHYGDLKYPRCSGCDELIFAREYTWAEEQSWHLDHFCCFGCDGELGGKRYMVREENPYCLECYMRLFARTCESCGEKIAPDVQRISHRSHGEEYHWHATPRCFLCRECGTGLKGRKFVMKNGETFCSSDCKSLFAARRP